MSGEAVENVTLGSDGGLRHKGKLIIPHYDDELKHAILAEAHNSKLTIHPGSTKMYRDLQRTY